MGRKRITQIFPWLLPLRKRQRLFCFYAKMRLDGRRYAEHRADALLPYTLFETRCPLYNRRTGFPMRYQENKAFNVRLAAAPLNRLVIRPGETFSFWRLVRRADRRIPYKDGLTMVDGKLTPQKGGGLCQLSNLLFWMFLHTPLTVVERHGHAVKDFPEPPSDASAGVDATVAEGWLDLRVKNDTAAAYQIVLAFDGENIAGRVLTDRDEGLVYRVEGEPRYSREGEDVYEETAIVRRVIDRASGEQIEAEWLYTNRCRIGYPLPEGAPLTEKGQERMDRKTVVIVFGGCSSEYAVSLASAAGVLRRLDKSRYVSVPVGITRAGDWYRFTGDVERIAADTWHTGDCDLCALSPNRSAHSLLVFRDGTVETIAVDAVFPVLHGKNGEDGSVQGLCELAGIPLVGCGTLASALCMDKDRAHKLAQAAGVAVPRSVVIERGGDERAVMEFAQTVGYPLYVKPVKAGSSYGVARVTEAAELPRAIAQAAQYDDRILVEEGVPGFEVGCAVMGGASLTIGEVDEIELTDGLFDYEEKYHPATAKVHVPARIAADKAEELKRTASVLYRALDCRGFARVDMFLTPSGDIVFNEINTIPGFTAHSRFPTMMRAAGIPFDQVLSRAVEQAVNR